MNPEKMLFEQDGQELVRAGGFILPAEDFNLARFLRDELGTTWLHAGGLWSTRRLLEQLDIKPEMRVLDLGCGVGSATRYIARKTKAEVVGIDADAEMIGRARELASRKKAAGVQFEQMDGTATTFGDATFDRVIVQSVACFADKPSLFREVARILKSGGRFGMNEVTWLRPPTEKIQRVMCSTICETFRGALLAEQWIAALEAAGLTSATCESHPFNSSTPYQILREEGLSGTLGVLWRVMREPEVNMRLAAMSDLFKRSPEYFSYAIYTARKPGNAC